jgi:molybdate transport system ATP-binding protein
MSLEVSIHHTLRSFKLQADFQTSGPLTVLFGPSGCGKTTVINAIAGLLRSGDSRIVCGGTVLADSNLGIWVPPHLRQVGYVFQEARLLPHLSVSQNLKFGQWFTPAKTRYANHDNVVELLGLGPLLDRRPRQLSGGEKQRVAIGRALLQSPRLLLMDEPLASLDEARKQEIIPYIERLRDEARVPIVYVSHALPEVIRLATDVVLMSQGQVVASGPVQQVIPALSTISDDFSREAGAIIEARVKSCDADTGLTTLESPAGELRLGGITMTSGINFKLHLRATDVTLATEKPLGLSALNILDGLVQSIDEIDGFSVTVSVKCENAIIPARITSYSAKSLGITKGRRVYAIIKAMSVRSHS